MKRSRIGLTGCLTVCCLLSGPAHGQAGAPAVEQDCARGETPHEVFARDNVGGGTFGHRLHLCVQDAAHGLQVFQRARTEIARDPYLTPAMRASLLRQIDAKIAFFQRGSRN
ncbi:MAG: hypothetical protein Q8R44_05745 [Novosphingobium sp.]|nr:hypothetical protein [Novosphingobium sp.]